MASTQLIMVASAPTDTHKAIEKLRTKVKKSTDSLMTTCYITPGAFQDGHGNEWYSKWKGQVNGALTTILQVAHGDGAIELRLVVLQGGPACTQEVEWIRSNLSSLAAEYASRGVCFKTPMLLEDVIHLEYLCNNPTQDGDVCAMPKRRNRPSPVSSPHHHHHRAGTVAPPVALPTVRLAPIVEVHHVCVRAEGRPVALRWCRWALVATRCRDKEVLEGGTRWPVTWACGASAYTTLV